MSSWKIYENLRYDWYLAIIFGILCAKGFALTIWFGIFINLGIAISHYHNVQDQIRDWLLVNMLVIPVCCLLIFYCLKNFYNAYIIAYRMSLIIK